MFMDRMASPRKNGELTRKARRKSYRMTERSMGVLLLGTEVLPNEITPGHLHGYYNWVGLSSPAGEATFQVQTALQQAIPRETNHSGRPVNLRLEFLQNQYSLSLSGQILSAK
ncbi:hypothetical protein RRG08_037412 [Elysia crispata]|uniref:Uncharacterized protein n=1 Tax=Elysia crispata TaxID=231223 RepID=A0AAE1DY25_9GAST|nr:hypothetical protein RRG08_037412 [Elysia crispata]